jgi:hypothetical protein
MLVRVRWLKYLAEIETVGRDGITSLVEEDIAEVLEKFGFLEVDPKLNEGSKSKLFKPKAKKVETRPAEK